MDTGEFKGQSGAKKALFVFKLVVRVFGFLTGIGSLILGGVAIKLTANSLHFNSGKEQFMVALVSLFCIIFGLLLIIAETRNKYTLRMMKYFLFLATYIGRGIFYIIVGVLCLALPIKINGTSWGNVVGGCMCAAGFLNIVLFPFVFCMEPRNKNKPQRFEDDPSVPSSTTELPGPLDNSVGSSKPSTYNPPSQSNPFDD